MPVIFDHATFALSSPEFHWPNLDETAKYFCPLERAGGLLVRELARVGWDVPGIHVEVDTYGRGEDLIRCVRKISGSTADGPFELKFAGSQGRKGAFNVLTGLSEATIPPGISIRFYDDRSGPRAHLYVGKDWKKDGKAWISDLKVNSKLDGKPRTYLAYKGWGGGRLMKHDAELGREYSPEFGEPWSLDSDKIAGDVVKFVDRLIAGLTPMPSAPGFDNVTPQGDANMRRLATIERIPAPDDFPLLYAWVDRNNACRLQDVASGEAESGQRYGLSGSGYRLARLSAASGDLPPRATDGFTYASADPTVAAGHVIYSVSDDASPVVVKLKWLNDVYVVDSAAYDRARDEVFARIEAEKRESGRMTDNELDACAAATAQTMVPVTEYAGGFEKPTYLIGRQTEIDEVRSVKGPVVLSQQDGITKVVVQDDETNNEFEVFSREAVGERTVASARRVAENVSRFHGNGRYRDRIPKLPDPGVPPPDAAGSLGLHP